MEIACVGAGLSQEDVLVEVEQQLMVEKMIGFQLVTQLPYHNFLITWLMAVSLKLTRSCRWNNLEGK